jgi:hypothetical protein
LESQLPRRYCQTFSCRGGREVVGTIACGAGATAVVAPIGYGDVVTTSYRSGGTLRMIGRSLCLLVTTEASLAVAGRREGHRRTWQRRNEDAKSDAP